MLDLNPSGAALYSDAATTAASNSCGAKTGTVAFAKSTPSRVTIAAAPAFRAASCSTASSTTTPPTRPRRSGAGCSPIALRAPLHPHRRLLAEPRRALVCRADRPQAAARRPPFGARAQRRHPRLTDALERRPAPLHLDQDHRPDPRDDRRLP